jgi:NADH-quinone oxidoreductase subunit L
MRIDPIAAALPAVPFTAALIGLLLPFRSRRLAAILAISGAAGALVLASVLVARSPAGPDAGVTLVDFGGLAVTFGTWVDGPAGFVAVAVAVVALCVQTYSVSYLHDDERYPPYAAQVSLFTSAMLLVVVAGDLIPLIVGWEVMGICSYLLIGHDRSLPEAPKAAVKAFIVTRFGDVGFILGVAILGVNAHSFRIADVLAADYSTATLTAAGVLLLGGVAGKSAQFPLHTWLPDAMAGPTPISALIHAATMVAAGVYLIARLYPLFNGTALAVLAVMASITMLLGATTAMAQQDIKKVLAWSTVSQLGYMTGALAVGSKGPALLHLLSHAAFKALLFLSAGAIIHAVGSNLMTTMGGLRKSMPTTFVVMTIGLAALVGLPPLAGFVSKDAILAAAQHATTAGAEAGPAPSWAAWLVWLAGLTTTGITGWYATRLWLRTFFGPSATSHAHEPPWLMRGPLLILAVPSALFGLFALAHVVTERLGIHELEPFALEAVGPLALATLGSLLAWNAWRRGSAADPARLLPGRKVLVAAYGLDAVVDALVTRPVTALASLARRGDEAIVDGAVVRTGTGTTGIAALLATAHRAPLPRAVTATLSGVLLIAITVVMTNGVVR